MNSLERYTLFAEALSPLHIGSGVTAGMHERFFVPSSANAAQRELYIIDIGMVCERLLADNPAAADDLANAAPSRYSPSFWRDFVGRHRIDGELLAQCATARMLAPSQESNVERNEIRRHVRTTGRLLLPGSSVKGALRSVWFRRAMLEKGAEVCNAFKETIKRRPNASQADNQCDKAVFGSDPNHDVFRAVSVCDGYFESPWAYLDAVSVFSHKRPQGFGSFLIETTPEGAVALFEMRFDRFIEEKGGLDGCAPVPTLETLFNAANESARALIDIEQQACGQIPALKESMVSFYDGLLEKVSKAAASKRACIVRIGFGSGFDAVTGAWMDVDTKEDLKPLIKEHNKKMGASAFFPASRRLVDCGDSVMPFGWVRLSLDRPNSSFAYESEFERSTQVLREETARQEAAARAAALEEARRNALTPFERAREDFTLMAIEGAGEMLQSYAKEAPISEYSKAFALCYLESKEGKEKMKKWRRDIKSGLEPKATWKALETIIPAELNQYKQQS